MRHNFIDRYAGLDSPLHLLEPRTKLLAFTALIVAVLSIPMSSGSLFFAYFFATAILMGISQIPLGYIVGRTLVILPFIVLASLAVPWRGYTGLGAPVHPGDSVPDAADPADEYHAICRAVAGIAEIWLSPDPGDEPGFSVPLFLCAHGRSDEDETGPGLPARRDGRRSGKS